jgi:hypothetical protein
LVTLWRAVDAAGAAVVVGVLAAVAEAEVVDFMEVVDDREEAASMEAHGQAAIMLGALLRCRDQAATVRRCKDHLADDNLSVDCQRRALDQVRGPAADRLGGLVAGRLRGPGVAPDRAAETLQIVPALVPAEAADLGAVSSREVAARRNAISITS